jgi:hypothetical protein
LLIGWEWNAWLAVWTDIGRVQGIDVGPRSEARAEQLRRTRHAILHHQTVHINRHTAARLIGVLDRPLRHFGIGNKYRLGRRGRMIIYFVGQIDGAVGLCAVQFNLRHTRFRVRPRLD